MNQNFTEVTFDIYIILYQKLIQPSCLPKCIEELCGGWTQETLKQIIQKITKKNQAPLPLYYDSPQSMELISNKKQAIAQTFKQFDSRGLERIDATEMFAVMLLMCKGEIDTVLTNIVEVFGQNRSTLMTADDFFFFLDCLFRGLSKICITNEGIHRNRRLVSDDLQALVDQVYQRNSQLENEVFQQNLMNSKQLYDFLTHITESLQNSLEYARVESLKTMKIQIEVKRVMVQLISDVVNLSKK